jgi:AP-1 complex subunit sigma 1/2
MFLISRQGKTRLTKWYGHYDAKERGRAVRDVTNLVLGRPPKMCAFIEWKDKKIVYKRYGTLIISFVVVDVVDLIFL